MSCSLCWYYSLTKESRGQDRPGQTKIDTNAMFPHFPSEHTITNGGLGSNLENLVTDKEGRFYFTMNSLSILTALCVALSEEWGKLLSRNTKLNKMDVWE